MSKTFISKTRFLLYASPWLYLSAIGLLVFIVTFFGVSNYQRERQHFADRLVRKGQDLIHFIGAGVRASLMHSERSGQQIQQLIEQTASAPDIIHIIVYDNKGKILAHSNPENVGKTMTESYWQEMERAGGVREEIHSSQAGNVRVFEVSELFNPFRKGRHRGSFFRRNMPPCENKFDGPSARGWRGLRETGKFLTNENDVSDWCRMMEETEDSKALSTQKFFITVGLDMSDLRKITRKRLIQISVISIAILLVSLGGLVSLLTLQGYRVAKSTLTHMKAFTSLIISELPVGIMATDKDGKINTMNQKAAELTGLDRATALGRSPDDVLPPRISPYLSSLEGKEQREEEIVFTSGDRGKYDLKLSSLPICDENGISIGRGLLILDLTELKKLQKKVQQRDRLISLGKMAAGVAHEVRNPLSSIKGFATLLGNRFQKGTEEHEGAHLLIAEVERLNRAITELLHYAKPLPLKRQAVDIQKLIEKSLKLIQSDALALGVDINFEVPDGLGPLSVDPDRLIQVLLNLYLNGLQSMQGGGRLNIMVADGEKPHILQIRIEDTGCGIAPENLDRVLDPYFTTKPDGTGLGLAMVNKIIEEHGGAVRIESTVNEGTTVILEFDNSMT